MSECAGIINSLSVFGGVFLLSIALIMVAGTAIIINYLISKFWKPVTLIRYVDIPVEHDPITGSTKIYQDKKDDC
jgi:hypothetical protein